MGLERQLMARRHPYKDADRLREEIAYMESRLEEIGYDGDCAYEKAIARFYYQQLAEYRDQPDNC